MQNAFSLSSRVPQSFKNSKIVQKFKYRIRGMTQTVECLPRKYRALSPNPRILPKKQAKKTS
jgi:hypothetical protein